MTQEEWASASLAELLTAVDRLPGLRKSDLLAVACARVVWTGLYRHVRDQIEQVERRADDPTCPKGDLYVLEDRYGHGTNWARARADWWVRECQEPLRMLFNEAPGSFARRGYVLPDRLAVSWSVMVRDIFGNPFRPVAFDPEWRTSTAVAVARGMYEARDFPYMSVLADALEDAGCTDPDILSHCRGDGPHVRGCWVVDLVLGKA